MTNWRFDDDARSRGNSDASVDPREFLQVPGFWTDSQGNPQIYCLHIRSVWRLCVGKKEDRIWIHFHNHGKKNLFYLHFRSVPLRRSPGEDLFLHNKRIFNYSCPTSVPEIIPLCHRMSNFLTPSIKRSNETLLLSPLSTVETRNSFDHKGCWAVLSNGWQNNDRLWLHDDGSLDGGASFWLL